MFDVSALLSLVAILCCDSGPLAGRTVASSAFNSLTSQVGGYAVFECPLPAWYRGRPHVVRWTKDEQTVFTISDGTLTVDERYDGRTAVVAPPGFGGGGAANAVAINVSSLRESDAGNYECRVAYADGAGPQPSTMPPPPPPPPPPLLLPLPGNQQSTTAPAPTTVGTADTGTGGVRYRLDVKGGDIMSIPPINQTRMEHESVHFSCVKEDPGSAVQWYKDGVPLDDLPSLNGRFHVTPEGSLDVYDAALNDNGFYLCRIVSAMGTLSAGAFLNVQYKAKIVYSPAEVFLAFGKPGSLDCHFHSNPPLTKIRWEKDGFLFDTYNVPGVYHRLNGSLYFDKVGTEHSGKYTCTPFNDLGTEGPSTPMDVIIQHPPKLTVIPKVLYFRKLGDNVTMPCEAEHIDNRSPAIVWQKADGKSLFDPRVIVTGGNLTLTSVRGEDRGVYRCVASNIAATISVETELIVEENLFYQKYFDFYVNYTGKNVVAFWKRPYSFCTVWSRDAGLVSSKWNATATSSEGKAILWQLNPDKEYEIMVSCQDEINGESLFSRPILTHLKGPNRYSQKVHQLQSPGGASADDPFDIRIERSGAAGRYNVSWTADAPADGEDRVERRYAVKWYDALGGNELGSAHATADEPYAVVELADGKTYGILVTATAADGQQTSAGSRTFRTPGAAAVAATATSMPSAGRFTKYYYATLFGLLAVGFVVLCCSNRGQGRRTP